MPTVNSATRHRFHPPKTEEPNDRFGILYLREALRRCEMPILLWVIYPFTIWSAYADMLVDRSELDAEEG